jgi:hypothetical protein
VPERKIIFIEIDDEITTIISKIEKAKVDDVALVFPEKALLFQSFINIKLLGERLKEMKKDVKVVTKDKVGKKLLEKAGLSFYEIPARKLPKREVVEGKDPIVRIQKLKPTKTLLKPMRSKLKKISLTQLIADEERKKKAAQPKKKNVGKELEMESSDFKMWSEKLLNLTIKRRNFLLFLIAAIGLFLAISYIALPSATIKIRPASNIIEKTTNMVLLSKDQKRLLHGPERAHAITTFPVETIIERTEIFPATGNIFTGANAKGEIKIFNERLKPWVLVEGTRFQTEEGIVYRMNEKVKVPGATYGMIRDEEGRLIKDKVPGTLLVNVEADQEDVEGKIVGERGNIETGRSLILPALDPTSQKVLYAEANEDFTGGVTETYTVLTEEDLGTAADKIKEHIYETVEEEFKIFVERQNMDKGLSLKLLDDEDFIQFHILELNMPREELNKPLISFEAEAKMLVKGIAYDEEEFYRVLENELKSKVHPEKKLVAVDRNSMTYRVVTSDSIRGDLDRIKLAVTIKGIEEYDLSTNTEKGYALIDQIKENTLGKNKDEARYFIQNLQEVNNVEIRVWPFWSNTIPALDSNITFKIL